MRIMCLFVILAVTVVGGARSVWPKAGGPTCATLLGKWKNQLGSTLDIQKIDATTGAITGTYQSPSGGGTTDFPLIGWVNSRAATQKEKDFYGTPNVVQGVSFTVRWGSIGSITAWVGQCEAASDGASTLVTMWNLVRPVSGFSWDHVLSGSDRFTPEP
jgi:hypothetical protein